jgi:hypothetical protein
LLREQQQFLLCRAAMAAPLADPGTERSKAALTSTESLVVVVSMLLPLLLLIRMSEVVRVTPPLVTVVEVMSIAEPLELRSEMT